VYKLVTRAGLAAVSASLVLAAAGDAHASGFAVARFGGPHGNPTEVNPSALYFNPAGLALSNGTNVLIDINWAQRSASYTRGENAVGLPADDPSDFTAAELAASSGEATLNNFVYAPALLLSSDFGLDLPFRALSPSGRPWAPLWPLERRLGPPRRPVALPESCVRHRPPLPLGLAIGKRPR
jgi:hypothetical protein